MDLDIVAVDEAKDVKACGLVDAGLHRAVNLLAAENATVEIDDLQGGAAFVEDDPVAVVVKCKTGLAGILACARCSKHHAEAAGIVGRAGLEGVVRLSMRWR